MVVVPVCNAAAVVLVKRVCIEDQQRAAGSIGQVLVLVSDLSSFFFLLLSSADTKLHFFDIDLD